MTQILRRRWVLVLLFGVLVVAVVAHFRPTSANASASRITEISGALDCSDTGFYFKHDNTTIWSCNFVNTGTRCVIYRNGIASDATDLVKATFEGVLNGDPSCLHGYQR